MRISLLEFHNATFRRQISIAVTGGVLVLALLTSLATSWQGGREIRTTLETQGRSVTEILAHQSKLALLLDSRDNVADAVAGTLAFGDVTRVEVRRADGQALMVREKSGRDGEAAEVPPDLPDVADAVLEREDAGAWRFVAPVQAGGDESPFQMERAPRSRLGYVRVTLSKATLTRTVLGLLAMNMALSFLIAFALLYATGLLTARLTRPLAALADAMGRAELGETGVRAGAAGPQDIAQMGQAFNSMIAALQDREHALRESQASYREVVDSVRDVIFQTDAAGAWTLLNPAWQDITGVPVERALGRPMTDFISTEDQPILEQWQARLRSGDAIDCCFEVRFARSDASAGWLEVSQRVRRDALGGFAGTSGILDDITERKAAEKEIAHLAFYDPLTQLPNRRLLLDRLQQALASSARSQRKGALLFIDLDNFKMLNDTSGHDVGDQLLIEVARRLATCVREGDTIARLGGDEFVIMLEDLSRNPSEAAAHARSVGEKILAALNRPYSIVGRVHYSTPSIGLTLFIDAVDSVDELLKQADIAMYQAKSAGRNTLRFFDPDMQASLAARALLEAALRLGIQNQQFVLHYQPQVSGEREIIGAEALVRWEHPERGLMPPAQFIPLAEETGLILPIGQWVLQAACAQLSAWAKDPSTSGLTLAINVSGRQFRQPDFVDQVQRALTNSGAPAKRLKVELTESVVLENVEDTIAKMEALKRLGVGFSMDDFGTGYSSLSYLTRLPLDQLKIDQSFVRNLPDNLNDAVVVQTIITLARSLGLAVIAEGVETEAQRLFLVGHNCPAYQGYLFSKPVALAAFEQLITRI